MKSVFIAIAVGLVVIAMIIAFGQIFTVRFVTVEFTNSVSGTDKQEILNLANIGAHTNIFVLNEEKIINNINNGFYDKEIKVKSIIRQFPNKVIIQIEERIALFKINAKVDSEEGFVLADRNFQRSTIYPMEQTVSKNYIEIEGFIVNDSYKTKECYALRDIANGLISQGFSEESIPYFIRKIEFTDTNLVISLRSTETHFFINNNTKDFSRAISNLYLQYYATSPSDRERKNFNY